MDRTISAMLSPPPTKTPPTIRLGTQIMPPAQTAAIDSQLCLCDSSTLKPSLLLLMKILLSYNL
ncbi:hypothetical protein [Dialister hominis]|uniref:hypothetical protein n=1 Tax=Dialister hominis TaxID=2582419 RepID=UPI003AACFE33